jgi:transketolase
MAQPSEKIFFVMSDEDHSGLAWDAIHFAANQKITNIIVIIDRNHIQQGGNTEDISPLEPLRQKYEAFGWKVLETDGHHIPHLIQTIEEAKQTEKPTAIIAHTTPGKGISELENRHEWTHKQPTETQRKQFIEALK